MRIRSLWLAISILGFHFSGAIASNDVVIVGPDEPTAFLESAPPALETRMRHALMVACAAISQKARLCSKAKIRFLRDVSTYGTKLDYGAACPADVFPKDRAKYVARDNADLNSCVSFGCDRYTAPQCEVIGPLDGADKTSRE
jgi:hypothetical protein